MQDELFNCSWPWILLGSHPVFLPARCVSCANNLVVCSLLSFRCIDPLLLSPTGVAGTCSFCCNVWREVLLPRRYHVPESLSCVQHGIWEARPTERGVTTSLDKPSHAIALESSTNISPNSLSIPSWMPRTCTRGTRKSRARGQHWRHMTETRIPLYRCNSGRSSWSRTRDEARATIHVNHTWTKIFRLFLAATSSLEIETKRMIQDGEGAVAVIMI